MSVGAKLRKVGLVNKKWIGKNVQGSCSGLYDVLSRDVPGETEKLIIRSV